MRVTRTCIIAVFILTCQLSVMGANSGVLSLAGEWDVKLDPTGKGVDEKWFKDTLQNPTRCSLLGMLDCLKGR